ncbi:helix-turn-helix transcriptional regulator [Uniformispora flossi]|uniref:helix-turn-helix transcriptional regulator n=1 Tax=Uniformispora flossi TaxID=3390723 RepID=UPI003C307715
MADVIRSAAATQHVLLGRRSETDMIVDLLEAARRGRSRALVLRGPAGIGKSALLDWAARAFAEDATARVIHVRGIESEVELPYAALHMLFGGWSAEIAALPLAQAGALHAALGSPESDSPAGGSSRDRLLVGLGALTLLSDVSASAPLLCIVDDAQWLDEASATALSFAARRLDTEGVVMLFAVRDHEDSHIGSDLPELRVAPLSREDSYELLAGRAPGLQAATLQRVIDVADGNPLALIELCALISDSDQAVFAGDDLVLAPGPVSDRIERTFGARVRALPEEARSMLLTAATEDTGVLTVLAAAANELGDSLAALEAAERAKLIDVTGDVVTFRHPLIRRVVYRQAPLVRRLATHQALARVLTSDEYADRRAWHLAAGTAGTSREVATALESAADRAQNLGAYRTSAMAYERAASFATEDHARAKLLASSAQAMLVTGRLDAAQKLATRSMLLSSDPLTRAESAAVRAHVEQVRSSSSDACRTVLDAAAPLVRSHPSAAQTMLSAVFRWLTYAPDPSMIELAAPLADAIAAELGSEASVQLTAGRHAALVSAGRFDAAAPLVHALAPLRKRPVQIGSPEDELANILLLLAVEDAHEALLRALELLRTCRERGMTGLLPEVLHRVALAQLGLGALRQSKAAATEGLAVADAIGTPLAAIRLCEILAVHAAISGDEEECRNLGNRCAASTGEHDEPQYTAHALSTLDMGYTRYESAISRTDLGTRPFHGLLYLRLAPNHIEAAVRLGRRSEAAERLTYYLQWAAALGDNPAVTAVAYRCRALVADDEDAKDLWLAAIECHAKDERPFEYARTLLLYGEWLRHMRKRADAREMLRGALARFERLGARPWAERTRVGLRACGVTVFDGERKSENPVQLTGQEATVAQLAAEGLADREIAARLFLSPRTVSYHLSNSYRKLGVSSRMALTRVLAQGRALRVDGSAPPTSDTISQPSAHFA